MMGRIAWQRLLLIGVCFAVMEGLAFSAILTVPTEQYPTVQAAAAAAADGDTIEIEPNAAPYTGPNVVCESKRLAIRGLGSSPEDTVLEGFSICFDNRDANYQEPVSFVFSDPNLNEYAAAYVGNLTVQKTPSALYGPSIICLDKSVLVARNCRFVHCAAWNVWKVSGCTFLGAGARTHEPLGGCSFANSTFVQCSTGAIDAVFSDTSPTPNNPPQRITITNCTFASNTNTERQGGALHIESLPATISHCKFIGNSSGTADGDAVFSGFFGDCPHWEYTYEAVFDNCLFAGNWSSSSGGAVLTGNGGYNWLHLYPLKMEYCTFIRNYAADTLDPEECGGGVLRTEYGDWPYYAKACLFWNNSYPEFDSFCNPNDLNIEDPCLCIVENCWINANGDPGFYPDVTGTWTTSGPVYDANTCTTTLTDENAPWAEAPGAVRGHILIPYDDYPNSQRHYLIKNATATTLVVWGHVTRKPPHIDMTYRIYDYHITSESPCRNGSTVDLLSLTDIDGEERGERPWDIGCDEYQSCGGSGAGLLSVAVVGLALTAVRLRRRWVTG